MTLPDSKDTSNKDLKKTRALTAAELNVPRSTGRVPGSNPVSLGRRLDVDAVLDRSVRRVVTE